MFKTVLDFYRHGAVAAVVSAALVTTGCADLTLTPEFAQMESTLKARGHLRTEKSPRDAPFDATDLERNFRDLAFAYELHFKDGRMVNEQLAKPLKRWSGTIRYKLVGDGVVEEDADVLAALTERLSRLTGLTFAPAADEHDLLISIATPRGRAEVSMLLDYMGQAEYRRRYDLWRQSFGWICGAVMSESDQNTGQLVYAHVFLRDELRGDMRRACLHEEVAQALGLTNDSNYARPSIFNDDQEFALLTRHDEILLSVLYDDRLVPGMQKDDAMPIVRRIIEGQTTPLPATTQTEESAADALIRLLSAP
ncbi:MAG: DUF2927 domain-containing protein [Pseudomonadota bacterium]